MADTLVIVAHGFCRRDVRLQPWRYIHELAVRAARRRPVVIVTSQTDEPDNEHWPEGFRVINTDLLSPRRKNELFDLVNGLQPTEIWWSTTALTIAYGSILKRFGCPVVAMLTGPIYTRSELWRASRAGVPFAELRDHWKQWLVPHGLFARLLNSRHISRVFVQSDANRHKLEAMGVSPDRISRVAVGIDETDRQAVSENAVATARASLADNPDQVVYGYFGAIRPVRGFTALMKAFPLVARQNSQVKLAVFARGADERMVEDIQREAQQAGVADQVQVIGGWLSKEQVWANVEACDAVVLPFVIVPSDVPIAILEALARGKPVIASPVDGIPELVTDRGIVVDPLNSQAMAMAMDRLARNDSLRQELGAAARDFMAVYPTWDEVAADAMVSSS